MSNAKKITQLQYKKAESFGRLKRQLNVQTSKDDGKQKLNPW